LLTFCILVVGVSPLIGGLAAPGPWYDQLAKPAFTPPAWVFASVWFALYPCIAVAGWLVWRRAPRSAAVLTWSLALVLNWIWSPIFFGLHAPWAAAFVIVALLLSILLFIQQAHRIDRRAGWLFFPYAAWVSFAGVLNVAIAVLGSRAA
jgi:tryptophan-rich sensory protein